MKLRVAIALSIAVAAAAPAPVAAAERNPQPDCGARKSRTLAASRDARVYLIPARDTVYVCAYRSNRRTEIGAGAECAAPRVKDFRFGRRTLGFVQHSCTNDFGREGIRVIALPSLRTVRTVTAITAEIPDDYSTDVSDWAMKGNGAVAWIGHAFPSPTTSDPNAVTPRYQVWKAGAGDPAGGTLLDSGSDIDPGSLALSAHTDRRTGESALYWRKGATALFATLR